MSTVMSVTFFIALIAATYVTWIAGAVIAWRASKRLRWPEARLAFIGFVSWPLLSIVTPLLLSGVGWAIGVASGDDDGWQVVRWTSPILALANFIPPVVIAIAIYQLAMRTAHNAGVQTHHDAR